MRLQDAEEPNSGLDFWCRNVGSLDAALCRLCSPGLLLGIPGEHIRLGIGTWLKRLDSLGEIDEASLIGGRGGRGILGGGVGGCCMLSRGDKAKFLESLGEDVSGGETTFEPNVSLLLEILVFERDSGA